MSAKPKKKNISSSLFVGQTNICILTDRIKITIGRIKYT